MPASPALDFRSPKTAHSLVESTLAHLYCQADRQYRLMICRQDTSNCAKFYSISSWNTHVCMPGNLINHSIIFLCTWISMCMQITLYQFNHRHSKQVTLYLFNHRHFTQSIPYIFARDAIAWYTYLFIYLFENIYILHFILFLKNIEK